MLLSSLLLSCSSLTVPGEGRPVAGSGEAQALLERSAQAHGDSWQRYDVVKVAFDGSWGSVVPRLQPDLVDADFRKASTEIYDTRAETVTQSHEGPGGRKEVRRTRSEVQVSYNGETIGDEPRRDASALVADAYTAFLFGSSWLLAKGHDLEMLEPVKLDGAACERVQGRLLPGFGFSDEDRFIAWVDSESGVLRRLQFTIEGLASTQGADVDVTFSEHWRSVDGSFWPGRFVEWVQRPVRVMAHDWRLTALELDGKKAK